MRPSLLLTAVTMLLSASTTSASDHSIPQPRATSPGSSAYARLASQLPASSILFPSNPLYASAQNGGFNPLNNVLEPACIVQPSTSAEVATIMKFVFATKANYAVRSGGHTGMAGWDSVQGGVLVDLSKMTAFSFDAASSTVTVEPGLRWGEIYNRSEPFGVAPMGGRVTHVGTGLILGGGLSLLSPQYGYACDGLISAEIVTPQGEIKQVSAASDPSLLRAIKGGGGRFGIVTKYELRAFPTGRNTDKLWYGGTITSLLPAGMDAMVTLAEAFVSSPDDPKATLLSNVGMLKLNGTPTWLGTTMAFYKGTQQEFESVFKGFLEIPAAIVDVKPLSYLEAAAVTPLGWASTQAYKWTGGSLYPNTTSTTQPLSALPPLPLINEDTPSTFLATWNNLKPFIAKHTDMLGSAFFSITPVRTTQIDQGYAAGGNALSPPQGRNYMHWLFSNILEPGTTRFPDTFERDRLELIKQNPSSPGLPLFLNEVDASQDAFSTYGWYDELRSEYKRFDPTGFSVRYQQGPTL